VFQSTAFSCVLDRDPLRTLQCYLWVSCLIELQAITPENMFVHHSTIENVDFVRWLQSRRVNLIDITTNHGRGPPCNRLRQLQTFSERRYGRVVLTDCGTAWVGDAPLPDDGPAAATRADFAHPPEPVLTTIFREAGLGDPDWVDASFPQGPGARRTDRNNCDGAFCIVAGDLVPPLSAVGANGPIGVSIGLICLGPGRRKQRRLPSRWRRASSVCQRPISRSSGVIRFMPARRFSPT